MAASSKRKVVVEAMPGQNKREVWVTRFGWAKRVVQEPSLGWTKKVVQEPSFGGVKGEVWQVADGAPFDFCSLARCGLGNRRLGVEVETASCSARSGCLGKRQDLLD